MKVVCVGWKLSRDELLILENTANYLQKVLPEAQLMSVDAYRHDITDGDEYIGFGIDAVNAIDGQAWTMPAIKDLQKKRDIARGDLTDAICGLKKLIEEIPVKQAVHIETPDKVTIGTVSYTHLTLPTTPYV